MQISKKHLDSIAKKLNVVSAAGRATLEQLLISAPAGYNEEALSGYLVNQYKALIESCATSAASLGVEEYNKYRLQQTGDASFQAMPELQYNPDITEDIVKGNIIEACSKRDIGFLSEKLGKNIDASVMHAYSGTHYQNAQRDPLKPRYARIPTSPTPCKFCLMLASRGFVYISKETAGDRNKYHPFCRCQAVPQFDKTGKSINVEGYNPDSLYEKYKNGDYGFDSKKSITKATATAEMPKIRNPILTTVPEPEELPAKVYDGEWNQVEDMQRFISSVFEPGDYVGVCGEFWERDGKYIPTRGLYQRTASRINDVLNNTHNVSSAVGRYKRASGAYVRINPLDGKGVSDINVKSLRYTLIECDTESLEQQYGYIKALNLPTKAIVTSGGKSVHALVRIDANDIDEYKQRVARLHAECKASGFNVDASTKNPSRYMRIPGVKRGDGRQVLVSLDEGANSWEDWEKWVNEKHN